MESREEHRLQHPLLYWAGAAHTPRDMDHMIYLIEHKAWPYLDRAERGEISLRDAVGAVKRKMRKEQEKAEPLLAQAISTRDYWRRKENNR